MPTHTLTHDVFYRRHLAYLYLTERLIGLPPTSQLTLLVFLTRLLGSLGRLVPPRSAISFQEPRGRVSLIASESSIYHDILYLVPSADAILSNDSRPISLIRITLIK